MSWSLIPVNLLFLGLGAMLYIYAERLGIAIPARTDDLFPTIALKYHGTFAGIVFLIGLVAAAYSSADGSLTALTTSFSIDILGLNENPALNDKQRVRIRMAVHIGFALFLTGLIIFFRAISDESVINKLFTIAGYTYGPLLGLFAFGLLTKRTANDRFIPYIAVAAPIICYFINEYSAQLLNGYKFGFELLLLNGFIVFLGVFLVSRRKNSTDTVN
jgi:Na+/proline symporter